MRWWRGYTSPARPLPLELGISGAYLVTPGDPARSVLSVRIRSRDAYGMPPLASHLVDEVGAQVIDDWISGLTSCP